MFVSTVGRHTNLCNLPQFCALSIYFMITRGEDFVDQGQQRYEEQQRQRSIAALKRRAADLGFQQSPTTTAA